MKHLFLIPLLTVLLLSACSDCIAEPRQDLHSETGGIAMTDGVQAESTLQWSHTLGDGSFRVMPYRLIADGNGDIFSVGLSRGDLNGMTRTARTDDCFVGKLRPDGSVGWLFYIPSPYPDNREYNCYFVDILRDNASSQVTVASSFGCYLSPYDERYPECRIRGTQAEYPIYYTKLTQINKISGEIGSSIFISPTLLYFARRASDGGVLAGAKRFQDSRTDPFPAVAYRLTPDLQVVWEVEMPFPPNSNLNPVVLAENPNTGRLAVGGQDAANWNGFVVMLNADGQAIGSVSSESLTLSDVWGLEFGNSAGEEQLYVSGWYQEVPFQSPRISSLTELRPDGTRIWRSEFTYESEAEAADIRLDSRGNIWQAGAWGFSTGFVDGFLRGYGPEGDLISNQTFGTDAEDYPWAMDVDGQDNVIVMSFTWNGSNSMLASSLCSRGRAVREATRLASGDQGHVSSSSSEVMTTIYKFAAANPTRGKGKSNAGTPKGGGGGSDKEPRGKPNR